MNDLVLGVLVAAAAGYAVSRALTTDSLVDAWRTRFKAWAYVDPDDPSQGWQLVVREARPVWWATVARGKFADLITCPFCLGFWLAFAAYCLLAGDWPWQLGWDGWVAGTAAGGVQQGLVAATIPDKKTGRAARH